MLRAGQRDDVLPSYGSACGALTPECYVVLCVPEFQSENLFHSTTVRSS